MDKEHTNDNPKTTSQRRAVTFVALTASFLTAFAVNALSVATPAIGREFGADTVTLGWIMTAFMLTTVAFMLPIGRLADLTGRRNALVFGAFAFSILLTVTIFVDSITTLIILRAVQGVGVAALLATNQAILVDAFPPQMRGRVLGWSVAAVYVGLSLSPILGGFITETFDWRGIFLVSGIIGFITAIVAVAALPKDIPNVVRKEDGSGSLRTHLDLPGNILYMISVSAIVYGFNILSDGIHSYAFLGAGIILLILFARVEISTEKKGNTPLLSMSLFRGNQNFVFSNLGALLNYGATFAITYLLSIYLQLVKGLSADYSGLVLIAAPIAQTFVAVIAGRLSDKRSPYTLASLGMGLCAISLFVFIFIDANSSILIVIAGLVCAGVGIGFFSSPNMNAIMSTVPSKDYSIAVSIVGTMRNAGMSISMGVIAIIMSMYLGRTPMMESEPAHFISGMRVAFIVFTAVCFAGVFISRKRK